jgi:hypothetical protein
MDEPKKSKRLIIWNGESIIYKYTQTRAFVISKRSMKLYEQLFYFHMEINMSKGVGEQ